MHRKRRVWKDLSKEDQHKVKSILLILDKLKMWLIKYYIILLNRVRV